MKCILEGYDTRENQPFTIEIDTNEDIKFTRVFIECFDDKNNYQIPIEYINKIYFI